MAIRRLVLTLMPEERAELVALAGGEGKLREYARRRLLGEPAAALAERYRMALEAIGELDDTYEASANRNAVAIVRKALDG